MIAPLRRLLRRDRPSAGPSPRTPLVLAVALLGVLTAAIAGDAACTGQTDGLCRVVAPAFVTANKWQSLIGGVVTLVAAVLGAIFVGRQIVQADRQDRSRVLKRRRAQRAVMPMTMSRICDYAEQSADQLSGALDIARTHHVVVGGVGRFTEPLLHEDVVPNMVAMIEAAEAAEAQPYVELLSELQVHMARWRGFLRGERRLPHDVEEELSDAAELYARASNLIAANRPQRAAPDRATTRESAMSMLQLHDIRFEDAKALARIYDEGMPMEIPVRTLDEEGPADDAPVFSGRARPARSRKAG